MLSKEEILAQKKLKLELVSVPEWNGGVYLRVMTGAEFSSFEASNFRKDGDEYVINHEGMMGRLLVRCLCDEEGKRLFSDDDGDEIEQLTGYIVDGLAEKARKLNRLDAVSLEELQKNSEGSPAIDSGSR